MITLRPHQILLDQDIDAAKAAGNQVTLAVSPTGSGKTVLFSHRVDKFKVPSALVVHRKELLSQISFTLTRFGVEHRIVAPPSTIKEINRAQLLKLGKSCYNPNAKASVVSIDALVANRERFSKWGHSIAGWIGDEGHHFLKDNKWGKGVSLFTNAWGELYTAHSGRGDGKGLGRHASGLADTLVMGPLMRDLINAGYLVDYRIYCPPSDFNRKSLEGHVGANGEFNAKDVKQATRESHVLGDVVKSYLKIAPGLKGITFASDIEDAQEIAAKFRDAGVPAQAVSSKTPTEMRVKYLQMFEKGELLQLVNVDLFGEGYDVPDLEVVSFARPTASFQTYLQQFGRVLRTNPATGKQFGIVIDHVGNVVAHGLPDAMREQTLDARKGASKKDKDPDVIPLKECYNPECCRAYEAIHPQCPYCGTKPPISQRSRIEHVDGDLFELDPATLMMMRGEVERRLDYPKIPANASHMVAAVCKKRHMELVQAIDVLKESMTWWAGWQQHLGRTVQQSQRAFYYRFGIDVMSAQMLNIKEATELHMKIQDHINQMAGGKAA